MMTTSSIVDDKSRRPSLWDGQEYNPTDYHKNAWAGQVTLRTAFARSLNVPAIEVAEQAGYRNVADLAHKAGLGKCLCHSLHGIGFVCCHRYGHGGSLHDFRQWRRDGGTAFYLAHFR